MFDRTRIRCGCPASISLDCGADECPCEAGDLEVSARGMRFKSPWKFCLGSQLAIELRCPSAGGRTEKVNTEGIVVDCEEIEPQRFRVTLLFLDPPDASIGALRGLSHQLEAAAHGIPL